MVTTLHMPRGARLGYRPAIAGSTLPLPGRPADNVSPDIWADDLRTLAACGFTCIDLVDTWLSPPTLSVGGRRALRDSVCEAGVSLAGLSVIRRSIIDPVDEQQNLAYTFAAIDAAAELGAPILSIGFHRPLTPAQQSWPFWAAPSPRDDMSAWDVAVGRLRSLASYAAQVGVGLALELYEYTLLGSGATAARLVQEVGSPVLGINADLANLYRIPERLTETWAETLQLSLPYMNYWHVKNYRRAEHFPDGPFLAWPTALDDGDIDYRAALRMAAAAGYAGPLCVEHYGGDALWNQQRGLRYLSEVLETL
jgi:sugar phosphate isomerase/epimerase